MGDYFWRRTWTTPGKRPLDSPLRWVMEVEADERIAEMEKRGEWSNKQNEQRGFQLYGVQQDAERLRKELAGLKDRRCDGCAHWQPLPRPLGNMPPAGAGRCEHVYFAGIAVDDSEIDIGGKADLWMEPDFCCRKWEALREWP